MLKAAIDSGRERLTDVARRVGAMLGSTDDGPGRVHADREDDVVVFVVGMRVNALWKVHRWLPVALAGPRLVRELQTDSASALLGSWTFVSPPRTIGFVQYWESFEALCEYARDPDSGHLDAWRRYGGQSRDAAVGIWHETYVVEDYETIYGGVPPRGLGAAAGSDLVPATGQRDDAAGRLGGSGTATGPGGEEGT